LEERDAWRWLLGFSDKPEIDDIPPEFKDLVGTDTDAVPCIPRWRCGEFWLWQGQVMIKAQSLRET